LKKVLNIAFDNRYRTINFPSDWQHSYGYSPVLMETLVDPKRFKGTCYKAANWILMGKTTDRGRMDRDNKQHGAAVKEIYGLLEQNLLLVLRAARCVVG